MLGRRELHADGSTMLLRPSAFQKIIKDEDDRVNSAMSTMEVLRRSLSALLLAVLECVQDSLYLPIHVFPIRWVSTFCEGWMPMIGAPILGN